MTPPPPAAEKSLAEALGITSPIYIKNKNNNNNLFYASGWCHYLNLGWSKFSLLPAVCPTEFIGIYQAEVHHLTHA